ncbi:MAG TPA: prenyltransferase/squalene oxidase repeat-containing protein, partial [Phycisphaerae bacterium]|nr:prenyltransferase/squalene oxidase repeat-containing protein [Phycisphaerae bacterium]
MTMRIAAVALAAALAIGLAGQVRAQEQAPGPAPAATTAPAGGAAAIDAAHRRLAEERIGRGLKYLLAQRNPDGGWGFAPGASHPALTAMAVRCFLQHPDYGPRSQVVEAAMKSLLSFRQADGGFYVPKEGNQNYITSVAVTALAAAGDPRHKDALAGAVAFLRGIQIVPGSKTPTGDAVAEDHPYVGGVSYGEHGRPDLSNLGFWMEAMRDAGVKGDDPAMRRALAFVTRLQNRTEGSAGGTFVVKGTDDGGFVYAVNRKGATYVGESKAGEEEQRGLRSYGSMTYTGFKSMLYANVSRDDPRVRAAFEWIRKYWRLDSNPNMPAVQSRQGLYYYYHVFSKALRAW